MTCTTCIKLRKAAFAVIRTVLPKRDEKDKQNQVDGRGVATPSDISP